MSYFSQIELHRTGIGLAPKPGARGSATYVEDAGARPRRSCSCATSRRRTCTHLKELARHMAEWRRLFPGRCWEAHFSGTMWYRLARSLFEAQAFACAAVQVSEVRIEGGTLVRVSSPKGEEVASYLGDGAPRRRFLERLGKPLGDRAFVNRAAVLEHLALLQMKPVEQEMNRRGVKTVRQSWEESFWYRLAYHAVRELDPGQGVFRPAIDPASGVLTLTFLDGDTPVCRLPVPRGRARAVLKILQQAGPRDLAVFTEHEYLELSAEAVDRSWYRLSVRYGFGNRTVSLRDILAARRRGMSYLEISGGWIDLTSPAFGMFDDLEQDKDGGRLRLSASQLLRLLSESDKPVRVGGTDSRAEVLRRLLELKPCRPLAPLAGLASTLRPYQVLGTDWLRFLYENRLGGLLCDDMGLGKTHQAMALMLALREQQGVEAPVLVACPTTVMSHWCGKIRDHAPGLRAVVFHGAERDPESLAEGDVVVTSYGVLRNDVEELRQHRFALAVFDEIQYLKNRDTLGFKAAQAIVADVKLGLTGTPIENSLAELKALFDLVLPGYLGGDEAFDRRYVRPLSEGGPGPGLAELRRLIQPFVLRRLKSAVLDELPDKIEDTRTCTLSEDQVELYRDAIATRGAGLIGELESAGSTLPYIHVFALLNILKQICDHPALALSQLDRAGEHRSGKWELYCEILRECLDSGQKVVVFTQYLGMIELMRRHLTELGVEHAVLTGASTRRGEIVARFNDDPACRVFLGSLKAGGTGIDLVGGSVVIHYDRWWNAAREDQATDRVHRIGQKRAVQVFKLVTEGTLEEKIAGIIERKRQLMNSVVEEDDPRLAKIFTRDELIELLKQV